MAAAVAASDSRRERRADRRQSFGGRTNLARRNWQELHGSAAATWFERLSKSDVKVIRGARVFHIDGHIEGHLDGGALAAETSQGILNVSYGKLILATGARERFLPFPGWTLPNVFGAGGLQALMKTGLPVAGKHIVIAGTGPLLFAVASYARKCGAKSSCRLRADEPEEDGPLCGGDRACSRQDLRKRSGFYGTCAQSRIGRIAGRWRRLGRTESRESAWRITAELARSNATIWRADFISSRIWSLPLSPAATSSTGSCEWMNFSELRPKTCTVQANPLGLAASKWLWWKAKSRDTPRRATKRRLGSSWANARATPGSRASSTPLFVCDPS